MQEAHEDITVSAVVPVYNAVHTLERCVDSLINQGLSRLEILIVDNGSSDGSLDLIKTLQKKYPENIKVFIENQKGVNYARNRGIKEALGAWIQFLDADDALAEDKLAHQSSIIKAHPNIGYIRGASFIHNTSVKVKTYTYIDLVDEDLKVGLFKNSLGNTCSNLYRRSDLLAAGGWDESLTVLQDPNLGLSLLENGVLSIADNIPKTHVYKSFSQASVSRFTDWPAVEKFFAAYEKLTERKIAFLKQKDAYTEDIEHFVQNDRARIWSYYLMAYGTDHESFFKDLKASWKIQPSFKTLLKSAYRYSVIKTFGKWDLRTYSYTLLNFLKLNKVNSRL